MLEVALWILAFIASLAVLIKSADYFTEYSEKLGIVLGISPFIIGATVVSIGTSLPELASSIFAVLEGSSEIVAGNVVGSNIANIFLVLGAAAFLCRKPISISKDIRNIDLPILVASAFILMFMIRDGVFGIGDAVVALLLGAGYVYYLLTHQGSMHREIEKKSNGKLGWKIPLVITVSGIMIYIGAKYTIKSVIEISDILNLGSEIIAVSAVALGTSLPELTVSVQAARKGSAAIAVGNVIGSNIFNTFAVMGIPALLGALTIAPSIYALALPVMVAASIMFLLMALDRKIRKWEGGLLVLFYLLFIARLYGLI